VTICTAHRREHTSNVLPLTVSLLASPFSQVVSEHCETTDTGLCITTKCHVNLFVYNNNNNNMQYACLLPQLSPAQRVQLSLSRPVCLAAHRAGLPIQRRSPT